MSRNKPKHTMIMVTGLSVWNGAEWNEILNADDFARAYRPYDNEPPRFTASEPTGGGQDFDMWLRVRCSRVS